ncbi:MAG: hypothetical protein KY463_14300, partial [Actinobacteria bacterium]|nr:hypothetical protein [Actinomycetota bacterium]
MGSERGHGDAAISEPVIPDPVIPDPVIPDPVIPDPVIAVEGVWKVFGAGKPDRANAMARDGASRHEIQQATGQTVAVRDVTF